MPKYRVTPEMYPGVYRAGVGFFDPGAVIELPDAASTPDEVPSARLEPMDDAALAVLRKHHGEKAKPIPRDGDDSKPKGSGTMTMREAAIQMTGDARNKGRAADR